MYEPRITTTDSGHQMGPLARAIAAGGGTPLSIDPGGLGPVVVGAGSASALVARHASADAGRGMWWAVAAIIAAVATVVAWAGVPGIGHRGSTPAAKSSATSAAKFSAASSAGEQADVSATDPMVDEALAVATESQRSEQQMRTRQRRARRVRAAAAKQRAAHLRPSAAPVSVDDFTNARATPATAASTTAPVRRPTRTPEPAASTPPASSPAEPVELVPVQ